MRLIDTPANEPVLRHLRAQASPGRGPTHDLDGWLMHVHPDLSLRFGEVCPSGTEPIGVYGLHVLSAYGVAAGFVQGTGCLFLRLPTAPPDASLGAPDCREAFAAQGWYAIDPWASDLPTEAGLRRLRALTTTAYEHSLPLE